MIRPSLRVTPGLFAACAFGAALLALVVGVVIIDRAGETVLARQQAAIASSARDYFVAFAKEDGVPALVQALNRRAQSRPSDAFRYALLDADGRVEAGADVVGLLDTPDSGWKTVVEPDSSQAWRVLATPLPGGESLVVAEDLSARDQFRAALLRGSAGALLLAVVAVLAVGFAVNAILWRRAHAIARTADRIVAGDLMARAPVREPGDVFDHLGAALNVMLGRIEGLMTGMRAVTDSVTHDLRSPLMRMRSALGRAQDPALDEEARQGAIADAYEEADRALATLSALMDILHAESGLSREQMRRLDVGAMALEMGELFAPMLEDAGQTLTVECPEYPVIALAHELLLRQAVGNLLHNAAVHAGEGVAVRLEVAPLPRGRVRLIVADGGRGVPEEHLGRVAERFVRLDEARSRPGSGLGLSIAAACAKLHGGRLLLEDNGPGLKASFDLEG